MRVVVGGSLTWRQRKFSVLFIEKDSAMLRDEDGSEVEVALDELRHDATPVPSDTSGLLNLSLQVQDITSHDLLLSARYRLDHPQPMYPVAMK